MMPDWLNTLFEPQPATLTLDIVVRICSAGLFGALVCMLYFFSFGKRKSESLAFAITLVLLSVLVAMTTLIIGNNQALAFSLVGTLAIVRFRTNMDDTRDTAFVIFAVTVGMGSAVGALKVVLAGIPVVFLIVIVSLWITRRMPLMGPERYLHVKLSNSSDTKALISVLSKTVTRFQLVGIEPQKTGDTTEYVYQVRFKSVDWSGIIPDIKAVPGVVTVEVKGKN
jgi:hypothetical protein